MHPSAVLYLSNILWILLARIWVLWSIIRLPLQLTLPHLYAHSGMDSVSVMHIIPRNVIMALICRLDNMFTITHTFKFTHKSRLGMFLQHCVSQIFSLSFEANKKLTATFVQISLVLCYIPRQELRGTPQEAKYQTPSDLLTNISLFHLLYYLIWSPHLCCCSHYYIPVHHCILLTYLEQVDPCLVFY